MLIDDFSTGTVSLVLAITGQRDFPECGLAGDAPERDEYDASLGDSQWLCRIRYRAP
jgi:hypothetical protein